ncbi:helix-turn-helix transcriptional regulator [Actinoplanes sp. NPDC051470]|uniref:helix-turn-helix transcriptional regulator n=1 Tax=Actinoplanes sp. NPDC051470 TaxID=3157224 RepID=UPI003425C99D
MLPSRLLRSSDHLGWRSVHAEVYRDPPTAEFATSARTDLLLVLVTGGNYEIESRQGRSWRRAVYRPGSVGVTVPGKTDRLRWRAHAGPPLESLHLRLAADLIPAGAAPMDTLDLNDPYITASAWVLARALREGAPALYADSVAQAMTMHLARPPAEGRTGDFASVIDLLHARLGDDLTLDDLAAQAAMSKYLFLRMFSQATGMTPHRYLTRLRMRRAAELLRGTGQSVQQIAITCGYLSPGQFAAAFRREYGMSPRNYRR